MKKEDETKSTIFISIDTKTVRGHALMNKRRRLVASKCPAPLPKFRGDDSFSRKKKFLRFQGTHLQAYALNKFECLKTVYLSLDLVKIDEYIFHKDTEIVIRFPGAISEWEKIEKHPNWASGCKSVKIVCSDGELNIKF